MTRLGRRFLEKGRRSGSLFVFQSSMVSLPHPALQPKPRKLPQVSEVVQEASGRVCPVKGVGANVNGVEGGLGLGPGNRQGRWVANRRGSRRGARGSEKGTKNERAVRRCEVAALVTVGGRGRLHQRLHRS